MRREDLLQALGEISDEHVEEAAKTIFLGKKQMKNKIRYKRRWMVMAASVAFVILATALVRPWELGDESSKGDKGEESLQAEKEYTSPGQTALDGSEIQWGAADLDEVLVVDIPKENYIDDGENTDYFFEDFKGLKGQAGIIVKAEVLDNLSNRNSVKDKVEGSFRPYASVREIRILEVYQNKTKENWKEDDIVSIEQDMAILPMDGEYCFFASRGEELLLRKGRTYLLYLTRLSDAKGDDMSLTGNRVVIAGNGVIGLDDLQENHEVFFKEMIQALVEFESDCDEETKELFLNAEEIIQVTSAEELENPQFIKFTLETAQGTGKVVLEYEKTEKGLKVVLTQV